MTYSSDRAHEAYRSRPDRAHPQKYKDPMCNVLHLLKKVAQFANNSVPVPVTMGQ